MERKRSDQQDARKSFRGFGIRRITGKPRLRSTSAARPRDVGTTGAYEQIFVPHLGDFLRLFALLTIPAAWVASGQLSALVMFLVCGGTWGLRYYARTRGEDIVGQVILLFAGVFSVLSTYKQIGWLDLLVHFWMILVLTRVLYAMLLRHEMLPEVSTPRVVQGVLLGLVGMGVLLAVLWEIAEWVGHTFINEEVGVGYEDTLGDLSAGLLGSIGAVLLIRRQNTKGCR